LIDIASTRRTAPGWKIDSIDLFTLIVSLGMTRYDPICVVQAFSQDACCVSASKTL
jgi:hypothetical protein